MRGRRYRGGRRRTAGVFYKTFVMQQNFDMANGALSDDNKYVAHMISHQLIRNDDNDFNSTSNMIGFTGTTALSIVLSLWHSIANWAGAFKRAKALGITYKIEWKGRIDQEADGAVDGFETRLRRIGGTEQLYVARGHESFPGQLSDGNNSTSLSITNMLGLGGSPVIHWPHYNRELQQNQDTFTTLPTTPWTSLYGDRRVKCLTFSPQRNIHWVKWKPVSRLDKIYSRYNLDRTHSAASAVSAFDDDQRCGAIAFYRNLFDVTGFTGDADETLNTERSIYTITAYIRVKFYMPRQYEIRVYP